MALHVPQELDLTPEPDLHPIYPTAAYISESLSGESGWDPAQKAELVAHTAHRACVFGDLPLLQFLVLDAQAQTYLDLAWTDEDGLNLVDVAILGFGADSDRDVEREECVRFLISQGVNIQNTDNAGWTALHHAALLAPPTLISHLLTHSCSPLAKTNRGLTPLDIVTAHSIIPGKEDVALLLEEAMRYDGWTGGKMEHQRRELEARNRRRSKREEEEDYISQILEIHVKWWRRPSPMDPEIDDPDDEEVLPPESMDDVQYTPPLDFESMLVFDIDALPAIFHAIITTYQPRKQDVIPAMTLYLMTRFAALTCDHTWLESLIVGATDAIEEAFYNKSEDITILLFWLYNMTTWLHLMRCDQSISEACDLVGSSVLVEEVINSVFVFIIRFVERRIDQLLDPAIMEYLPPNSQADGVQFESEWSFLKALSNRKKAPPAPASSVPDTTTSRQRSATVTPSSSSGSNGNPAFQSVRHSMSRIRTPSATPMQATFSDGPASLSPADAIYFLDAMHTFMLITGINPALIVQIWSQVFYWTACETFNRLLTRKKYLCRSRAAEIAANIATLEDWMTNVGLPQGIHSHFAPVRDLLTWVQTMSSINDFPSLIAAIQQLPHLNPLQMRRAVREYKYEVQESKMTEECSQYLAQLQKDWERHRVKLGVEALRKEIDERDRDDSERSSLASVSEGELRSDEKTAGGPSTNSTNVDILFDKEHGNSAWEPTRPPQVLGELLDSRFMLPLSLPSDPRLLSAVPGNMALSKEEDPRSPSVQPKDGLIPPHAADDDSFLSWKTTAKSLRNVDAHLLQQLDGTRHRPRQWHYLDVHHSETVMASPIEGRSNFLVDAPPGRNIRRKSLLTGESRENSGEPVLGISEVVQVED